MRIDKVTAVSDMPGLYVIVGQKKDGVIIESLDNQKRQFAPTRQYQFTPLISISIYVESDEMDSTPLSNVFSSMLQNIGTHTPPTSAKASANELADYFAAVLPNYDRDQVKAGDIKKCIKWFTFLHSRNLLTIEDLAPIENPTEETPVEEAAN
jgi:hypothetical protein